MALWTAETEDSSIITDESDAFWWVGRPRTKWAGFNSINMLASIWYRCRVVYLMMAMVGCDFLFYEGCWPKNINRRPRVRNFADLEWYYVIHYEGRFPRRLKDHPYFRAFLWHTKVGKFSKLLNKSHACNWVKLILRFINSLCCERLKCFLDFLVWFSCSLPSLDKLIAIPARWRQPHKRF